MTLLLCPPTQKSHTIGIHIHLELLSKELQIFVAKNDI